MIPTSLRRTATEAFYQSEKIAGNTLPLRQEQGIYIYKHWVKIANRYPYDAVFERHDMLIPMRDFAYGNQMNYRERRELRHILDGPTSAQYDVFFENNVHRRSDLHLYHLHLATYYKTREEFTL